MVKDNLNKITAFMGRNAILPYYKTKYKTYIKSLKYSSLNQESFLHSLLKRNENSDFGRNYSFSKIASLNDYREILPIFEYKDLEPYLTRVAAGEVKALFPPDEKILAFGSTTGTTGTPKCLPITKTWLNTYQKWWQMWGVKILKDHPSIIGKRWLQITGSTDLNITKSGHKVGMVSAISAEYQNPIFQLFYATPREIGDLKNDQIRQYAISRLSMVYNVGFLITITAANLIKLAEVGNSNKEKIIKDIYDGTLEGLSEVVSSSLRLKIQARLLPRKKRALQLEALAKKHSELYPKHYWDIELVSCWTGGTVGYQTKKLKKYYGECAIRDIGYVSTEGRHTITLSDDIPSGPLIPDGAFYEFIPLGSTQSVFLDELEIGQEYIVLITTSNGLYRYKFDDIICCHGYIDKTPIIEFMRKTSDYSDLEGEKLSVKQVMSAVYDSVKSNNLQFFDFSFGGERRPNMATRYQIFLEPNDDIKSNPQILLKLIEEIDRRLISSNLVYNQKRNDGSLGVLNAVTLPEGTWKKFTSHQAQKRKTGESQYKHPVFLTSDQQEELQRLL